MIINEEQELIQNTAREFAKRRLIPNAAAWEEQACLPREVVKEMGKLGLLGMLVPPEWGGAGSDAIALALVVEEIAAGDGACATIVCGHNSVGCTPILQFGTEEQKQRYLRPMATGEIITAFCLSEAQGGSDASRIRTRATFHDNSWEIDGSKVFVTSGKTADVALVFAVTDSKKEKPEISCFIVPTSTVGYEVVRVEQKMGQNASDTCEIRLNKIRLPAEALLGKRGDGLRIALGNLECGRIGVAAQATGMARAALDIAVAYANERVAFGKPIADYQAVSFRLAEMATSITAARQLYLHAAELRTAGLPCLKEASMAKLFATEMAERVCSDAMQTLGGYGYMRDFAVERIYRSARVCKMYEGTNDIQKLVIARSLTGRR
jgi:butyryl-CoA dehydrogenase